MKHFLSIKQVYLDSINKGDKVHEYRLANEKRREVKIGDILVLQSEKESLEVKVTAIKIVSSWYEALKDYYQKDFNGVYSSLEETIEACNQFYPANQVEKYGIIIYSITK